MSRQTDTFGTPRLRVSLFVRMLLLLLLATLPPLSLFAFISIQRGNEAVGQAVEQNLQLVCSLAAARIDQLLWDTRQLQKTLATADVLERFCAAPPDQRPPLHPQALAHLEEVLSRNPDITLAFLADHRGVCIASTSPNMTGRDYRATREYMRRALSGEDAISDLVVGITTGEPGCFFAGPVRDDRQTITGALVLKLSAQAMERICRQIGEQATQSFVVVIDAHEVIIIHPDAKLLYHSIGRATASLATVDPKLQYGVERIASAGADDIAAELRLGRDRGCLSFVTQMGQPHIAGYARMSQRQWTIAVAQPRSVFDQPMNDLAHDQIAWIVLLVLASTGLAWAIARHLLRPIKALHEAAIRAAAGDWSARATVRSNDELGDLARAFNDMIPALETRSQLQNSLRLASEIQRRLLPKGDPLVPGLDVAGASFPAEHVGGDYYDFIEFSASDDSSLAILIGDVTGHGVAAALLMATARALLRSHTQSFFEVAKHLRRVNQHLVEDSPDGRFMTLMYALLDRKSLSLRLVSAGHDPVIVYDPDTDSFSEFAGNDLPLGVDPDWEFSEVEFPLPCHAILVFGTDGIWEALNKADEAFGKTRLKNCIRDHCRESAREISQAIQDAVIRFQDGAPQKDDITLSIVRIVPLTATAPLTAALRQPAKALDRLQGGIPIQLAPEPARP